MAPRLIAEAGVAQGTILLLEGGEEWTIGRDPDEATLVVSDPAVSRQHLVVRLTSYGYLVENRSETNPVLLNDEPLSEPKILQEDDQLKVGDSVLRFSTGDADVVIPTTEEIAAAPEVDETYETIFEEEPIPQEPAVSLELAGRFILKVVAGPNSGAELELLPGRSYTLGTDAATCDIVFHDLSVSRQHARLDLSADDTLTINDLESRNGVVVDGKPVEVTADLKGNSIVSLGTTGFLIIDREGIQETLVAPSLITEEKKGAETPPPIVEALPVVEEEKPQPILAGGTMILLLVSLAMVIVVVAGAMTLFQSQEVIKTPTNFKHQISTVVDKWPGVRFSYNEASRKLFLLGHVATPVDKSELLYTLEELNFIGSVDDNVVVDQYVWEETNALIARNPSWVGVSMRAPSPGRFVLSGYLKTTGQLESLQDYIHLNFPYVDRLDNQVVVEELLINDIEGQLQSAGFGAIEPSVTNGELVLTGYVSQAEVKELNQLVDRLGQIRGVRSVKNQVAAIAEKEKSMVDLSDKYVVAGYARHDSHTVNVQIDGQIVGLGDNFEGMRITDITPRSVILEKDGVKYRINYG